MGFRAAVPLAAGAIGLGWYDHLRRRRPSWRPGIRDHHRAGPLWAEVCGDGEPDVVLLHGLVGAGHFWGEAYDELGAQRRLIAPDLLGFGASDRPRSGYGPDDHARAVAACLDHLGATGPIVIGAHSLGVVIALRLAVLFPHRVAAIVGFGPPLYRDPESARRRIGASSTMARLFVLPGPVAEQACRWVCRHRALAAFVAPFVHPDLPAPLARGAVQHSWTSYSETLQRCLLDAPAQHWLRDVRCPVRLVAGSVDPVVDADFLMELAEIHPAVEFEQWPGGHRIPLTDPSRCRDAIASAARVAIEFI